jgi:tetratricopeptide (TPR) repeat protein
VIPPQQRLRTALWLLFPLLLAVAAFSPCVRYPLLSLDDALYVGALRGGLATPAVGYAVPVPAAIQAALRSSPAALHLANLAGHLLAVALLFALGQRLGLRGPAAALGAAAFAIHPVAAEPTAWVAGLKDVLAAAFALAALLSWGPGRGRALLVLGLGLLAMLCKPNAAMLPLVLLGADRFLCRGDRPARTVLAVLGAAAIALVLYAIVRNRAVGGLEQRQTLLDNLHAAGLVFFEQARNWLYPVGLVGRYMPLAARGDARVVLGLAGFALALGAPFVLRRACGPAAAMAALCAVAFYLPGSNLIRIARTMADSYLYLPAAGLGLLLGMGAQRAGRIALAALLAVTLSWLPLARARAAQYRSDVAYFSPILLRYPDSPDAWKWLADAHMLHGDPARALPLYQEIERRFPGYGRTTANLGVAWMRLGDLPRAEEALLRAPATPAALDSLAEVLMLRGRLPADPGRARARDALLRAAARPPEDPRLLGNLGALLAELGELPRAAALLEVAARTGAPEFRANLLRVRQELAARTGGRQ